VPPGQVALVARIPAQQGRGEQAWGRRGRIGRSGNRGSIKQNNETELIG